MDATVTPDNRADGFDIEAFEAMVESASFKLYTARVSRELVRLMNDCEKLDEPRDIYRAQGAAQMMEAVLRIPAIIHTEMLEGMKAKNGSTGNRNAAPPKKPR